MRFPSERSAHGDWVQQIALHNFRPSSRNANTLMAVTWRNWKFHIYRQDTMFDAPVKLSIPYIIIGLYRPRHRAV
jgi:hypothetical protein